MNLADRRVISYGTSDLQDPRNYRLRSLSSSPVRDLNPPTDFRRFVADTFVPALGLDKGYKRAEKRDLAVRIAHNLVLTGLAGRVVKDSRDNTLPGVRLRTAVWDSFLDNDLVRMCRGSESSGRTTRYQATEALLDRFRTWKITGIVNHELVRNTSPGVLSRHALVVLRQVTKEKTTAGNVRRRGVLVPLPTDDPGRLAEVRHEEDLVEAVNRVNGAVAWTVDGPDGKRVPLNPYLRRIYTNTLARGGRLYSWTALSVQTLPKGRRRSIRVGGRPVAYLDFASYALRQHYHLEGVDPDPDADLYRPELVFPKFYWSDHTPAEATAVRDFVKTATNTCFNVSHRFRAGLSVEKRLADNPVAEAAIGRTGRVKPETVVGRIMEVHKPVHSHFFDRGKADLVGHLDGDVMLATLTRLAAAGVPAMSFHDAVLCRLTDLAAVESAMLADYRAAFGFAPVVRREF